MQYLLAYYVMGLVLTFIQRSHMIKVFQNRKDLSTVKLLKDDIAFYLFTMTVAPLWPLLIANCLSGKYGHD